MGLAFWPWSVHRHKSFKFCLNRRLTLRCLRCMNCRDADKKKIMDKMVEADALEDTEIDSFLSCSTVPCVYSCGQNYK